MRRPPWQLADGNAVEILNLLDFAAGQLRVRQGKGKRPRLAPLAPSAQPALEDWLQVRGREPGPLFCAVLKTGRLVREGSGGLRRLSGSAAWGRLQGAGQEGGDPGTGPPRPAADLGGRSARVGRSGHRVADGRACLGGHHCSVRTARSRRTAQGGRPAASAVRPARRLNESEPCSNRRCAPRTKRAARCAPRLPPEAGAETGRLEDENTR